jgi:hypothetical protein
VTPLRSQIVTQIEKIRAPEWDGAVSIAAMRHEAIRALDSVVVPRDRVYALVSDADGSYAAIAARPHRGSALLGRVVLEVTPLLGLFGGIQLRRGVPLDVALPRLLPTLARMARRRRCPAFSVIVPESDGPTYASHGFASFTIPATLRGDLSPFSSYEAMLEHLPGEDRRNLARSRRRSAQYGLRVEVTSPPRVRTAELFALLRATYEAHANPLPFAPDFFDRVWAAGFAEHALFCAYLGERLVAGIWVFRDGEVLTSSAAAFDYELARPSYAYFTLLDEILRWAFVHGVRKIDWGSSNDSIKGRYGGAAIPALAAIRPAIPLPPGLWTGIRALLRSDRAARALSVPGRVDVVAVD